ncbi:MAG: PspC domain-containing protein [Acidimicrobiales bacterium]
MNDRVVGGVAAGLSNRVGLDKTVIRAAFVLITLSGGIGIAVYVLAWLFVPAEGEEKSAASRSVADKRGIALVLALLPLLVLTLVIASLAGASWLVTIAWPVFITASGLVLVWRNVSAEERAVLEQELEPLRATTLTGRHFRRLLAIRIISGAVLAAAGVYLLTRDSHVGGLVHPVLGLVCVAISVLIVFGPWWLHIARDLVEERQARALAEERADLAARVHDSVLQTLALIQRAAGNPHEVVKLARSQERELRSWLFEGRAPGQRSDEDATMSAAVERIQRDVEATHGIPVEAVIVGDCPLDDDLRSLVEAGREATVNAAKWSTANEVSLFVEVEPNSVAMYVRDRGKGFVEAAVSPDRRGLSESIRGRMARHGGGAVVRSNPGEGTEIILKMARR